MVVFRGDLRPGVLWGVLCVVWLLSRGAGLLAPLDGYFTAETLQDFLPTLLEQGTVNGRLYALGAFESAVVLYYDREMLDRADVALSAGGPGAGWTCSRIGGDFLWPLMIATREETRTVQSSLVNLFTQPPVQWGDILACAVMATLPVMLFFRWFQRYVVATDSRAGIK